jgi:hypothetical protein
LIDQLTLAAVMAPVAWAYCGWLCYRYERHAVLSQSVLGRPWRRADRLFCLALSALGPAGLGVVLTSMLLNYCRRRGNKYLDEPVDW